MRTSEETIRELERLSAERTQGEWRAEPTPKDEDGWSSCCGIAGVGGGKSGMIYATPPGGSFPASDKKVIAAAVNALPNLLADLRDLAAMEKANRDASLADPAEDYGLPCPEYVESATEHWEPSGPGVPDHCASCGCSYWEHRAVAYMNSLAAMEEEVEKLRPLHEAVGAETHKTVPKAVYDAWQDSAAYRRSEIAKLREQVSEAEHQTGVVRREMEARLTAMAKERDELVDALRRCNCQPCDIPACNCGSWHRRPSKADIEIDELRAMGQALDAAVKLAAENEAAFDGKAEEFDQLAERLAEQTAERDAAVRERDAARAEMKHLASCGLSQHGADGCDEDEECGFCDLCRKLGGNTCGLDAAIGGAPNEQPAGPG